MSSNRNLSNFAVLIDMESAFSFIPSTLRERYSAWLRLKGSRRSLWAIAVQIHGRKTCNRSHRLARDGLASWESFRYWDGITLQFGNF